MPAHVIKLLVVLMAIATPAGLAAQGGRAAAGGDKQGAPAVRMLVDARDGKIAEVCVTAEDRGAGVNKVELSVDGSAVRPRTRAAVRNETGEECPATSTVFDVELIPGINRLEAVAYSSSGVASDAVRDSVRGVSEVGSTTLHVLAIGIDAYASPTMRLSYARNDARAFVDSLSRQSRALFRNVVVDTLFDAQATDAAIKAKFFEMAERMQENDTFVFFYAGHGSVASFAGSENVFYLVPVNVRDHTDGKALAMTGLPAATLQQYLSWIPARSKLMVLDACNSGAMIEFFNGKDAMGSSVLGTIRSQSQIGILAATQPSQPARESGIAGHGLFTAALLSNEPRPGERVAVQRIREIAYHAGRALPLLIKQYGALEQEPWMQPPPRDFALIVR
ncbi:MAG: hypothetical protein C0503_03985 [Gemmatimonas sp.]|nr:hypothetical protein [Gemmatimonas sp.]